MTNRDNSFKWNNEQVKAYERFLEEIIRVCNTLDLTEQHACYQTQDGSDIYNALYSSSMFSFTIETNIEDVYKIERNFYSKTNFEKENSDILSKLIHAWSIPMSSMKTKEINGKNFMKIHMYSKEQKKYKEEWKLLMDIYSQTKGF